MLHGRAAIFLKLPFSFIYCRFKCFSSYTTRHDEVRLRRLCPVLYRGMFLPHHGRVDRILNLL